jgi:hypothetical protein
MYSSLLGIISQPGHSRCVPNCCLPSSTARTALTLSSSMLRSRVQSGRCHSGGGAVQTQQLAPTNACSPCTVQQICAPNPCIHHTHAEAPCWVPSCKALGHHIQLDLTVHAFSTSFFHIQPWAERGRKHSTTRHRPPKRGSICIM